MRYRDLYDEDFLSKFGNYKDAVSNLDLGSKQEIDVGAIANACDISVKFDVVNHSGWSVNSEDDENDKEVVINELEPQYRQRFTLGHEIGHIILGHKGLSYRTKDLTKYLDTLDRMNEVAANSFAAELIMPKKLVWDILLKVIEEYDYDTDQNFDDRDIEIITSELANRLNVSQQAIRFRVKNLGIFIDE